MSKELISVVTEKEEEEIDISIEQMKGVGPTTLKKLQAIGVETVYDVLIRGTQDIQDATSMRKADIDQCRIDSMKIVQAHGITRPATRNILDLMLYRAKLPKLTTGCTAIDLLLKGGIELETLMEVYGEFGSGKTQFLYSLAVEAIKQYNWKVLWIDCEDTFDPERFMEIIKARGYEDDSDKIINEYFPKIEYVHTPNTDMLMDEISHLSKKMVTDKIKLVVIDGGIGQFRKEFLGRETLSRRQNNLLRFMAMIKNISHFFSCAVVITNQVQADPGQLFGDPIKPIGGHVVGHTSTYRLYLQKRGKKRVAKMVDSPKGAQAEALFTLNDKGVDDFKE